MQRNDNEAERVSVKRGDLADQYRPIGPAAVLAALIFAAKKIEKADDAKKAA